MDLLYKPNISYLNKIERFIEENYPINHPLTNQKLFKWFYDSKNIRYDNQQKSEEGLSLILALENDRIISILGFYDCLFRCNENLIKGSWTALWFSVEKYRKGIGAILMKNLVDEKKIICGP